LLTENVLAIILNKVLQQIQSPNFVEDRGLVVDFSMMIAASCLLH